MFAKYPSGKALTVLAFCSSFMMDAKADRLPMLTDDPWTGWYSGWEAREFRFGVSTNGKGSLILINQKGDEYDKRLNVTIEPLLKLKQKGGWKARKIVADGWTAVTPEAADPDKIVFQGTVEGGIRFEVSFEMSGKTVVANGKVLSEDNPSKQPVLFGLMVRVPNGYYRDKNKDRVEEKAKKDQIDLVGVDGKRFRLSGLDDGTTVNQDDAVFRSMRIELSPFKGHRFDLDSGEHGHLEMRSEKDTPLYKGIRVFWKPPEDGNSTKSSGLELMLK